MGRSKYRLEIELIPESSWHISLANLLPRLAWDRLRRETYRRSNYTCVTCGATDTRINCHECWEYDDISRIQYLKSLQALCDKCHNIKHWGRTVVLVHEGKLPETYLLELTKHFCSVNSCTTEEFLAYKVEVGNLWQERSRHKYKVDFGKFQKQVERSRT